MKKSKILLVIWLTLLLKTEILPQQFRLVRPVPDTVQTNGSYLYGEPNFQDPSRAHLGLDIAIKYDTVYSASAGIVYFVGYDPNDPDNGYEKDGAGNYIIIKSKWNNKDIYLMYFHLTKPLINVNQSIDASQPIAISGNTGNSTGPHLHFEIRMNSPSYNVHRSRRNPELWCTIKGMGTIYGHIADASNSTRVDISPDPKPRPPYTTYGYSLTYNFNDPSIGEDDIYQENYAIGDVKPGTYTITALNGSYVRRVSVHAGEVVNADYATNIVEKNMHVENYRLFQNYPNPFNPQTQIKFKVPQESRVKIIIYNSLGQKIKKLVDGNKSAGYYRVSFDASGLSSGIYFYTFDAFSSEGDLRFHANNKMILLK